MRILKLISILGALSLVTVAVAPVTASANTGSGYKRMSKMEHRGMMQRHRMMHHRMMHHHMMMK